VGAGKAPLFAAISLLLISGCTGPSVVITDDCVPITEAVLLRETAGDPGRWSIGLVNEQLLFAYVSWSGAAEDPAIARAQWFGASLAPITEDFWLGNSRALPPFELAAHDGALWAQIWAERVDMLSPVRRSISAWRLVPGTIEPERFTPMLPITAGLDRRLDLTPADIGASTVTAGVDGRAPAALAFGRVVFALNAWPSACSTDTAIFRAILFDQAIGVADLNAPDSCMVDDGSSDVHNHRLVPLRDGGLGVFFRRGAGIGQGFLHYSRVGPDLALLDSPPIRVDWTTYAWNLPGGFQPQAVALGSGRLLFTNRDPESGYNLCQELRLVEPDGRSPRDAPYQLRCRAEAGALQRGERSQTVSQWVVVQPLAFGHAVIAYGERPNHDPAPFTRRVTSSVNWEEGVFLHTIDDEGRRASDIIRVTPPESTALLTPSTPFTLDSGPIPGDYEVQAITEGDDVVVAWRDTRPDAPGYYARRFRCTERPE